jgi:septum site-determining protein MinC
MPAQADEHRTSLPEEESGASNEDVRSRVSELLDNATVAPEDEFARDLFARNEGAQADGASKDLTSDSVSSSAGGGVQGDDSTEQQSSSDGEAGGAVAESVSDNEAAPAGESSPDELSTPDEPSEADASELEMASRDAEGTEPVSPAGVTSVESDREDSAEVMTADGDPDVEKGGGTSDSDILSDELPSTGDGDQVTPATVRIRGRPGGVLVEIEDEGEWSEILELLEQRLAAAEGFFRGGKAVVEIGKRDVYEDELRQARDMLARHDMTLAVVRSTSDLTLQSSLLLGLSTSSQAEAPLEADREMAPVVPITQPKSPYFVHNGTLRSGQVLRKAESIMIVGDVNPGAKVISGGDVMVWGRLRGMAYAGATGNKGARVAAIEFSPTQLRIASVTAVPPEAPKKRGLRFWKKPTTPQNRPEVAHVSNGRIVVELWDDSKPGRPSVARK